MRGFEATPPDLKALLPKRISQLGLKLEGSPVERYVQVLYRELERGPLPPAEATLSAALRGGSPLL